MQLPALEKDVLVSRRHRFIVPLSILFVSASSFAGAEIMHRGEPVTSFHGASQPFVYLRRLLASSDEWSPATKRLFVVRAIEAARWVGENRNTMLFQEDAEVEHLGKLFPSFKGKVMEQASVRQVGNALAAAYPHLKAKAGKPHVLVAGFREFASPSALIENEYYDLGTKKASASQWRKIVSTVHAGAAWERKHPDDDYGFQPDSWIMDEVKRRYPKLRVKTTPLGTRVRDLDAALQTVSK